MPKLWSRYSKFAGSRAHTGLRLAIALILCGWLSPAIAATTFTASLDPETITLGESATLSLTFTGDAPQGAPNLPEIPNLQIAYVGPSQQVKIVDGQMSRTVAYMFSVTPKQAGDFTIPGFTADIGGQKVSSAPIQLKVLKPGAPPPEAVASGSQLAFLKLVLPKKELYLNETVVAELQLYLNGKVQNIERFQLTPIAPDGFTVGKLIQGRNRRAQVGNAVYNLIPLTMAIKPIKAGALNFGPVTASLVVEVASGGRRRDSIFDQFGMRVPFDMFGGGVQQQVTVATEPETVQCLPLPAEKVPPGFNGAVGSYSMTVSVGPTNVAAGDPVTVKVQIAGRGALDALNLAEQTWRDFKIYPPTSKLETTDQYGIQGTKTFEQVVVPQGTEVKELPPIAFSFFDPDQKSYRTLTHAAVPLIVRPGGTVAPPTVVAANRGQQDTPPPTQDIVHIKPRLGSLAQIGPPLAEQPWFLALQGLPVLALVSAWAWRKRADQLANNPRLRRQRQVAQTIREGLATLHQLATEKKSDEFFALLFRLLQEQLGERLNLPASAITEAVIEEHLRPCSVAETTLTLLQGLFQTCNQARYAPIKTSQELAAMIPKLETVLRDLQTLKL